MARLDKSPRLPIGVATTYNPFFKLLFFIPFFLTTYSCTPPTVSNEDIFIEESKQKVEIQSDNNNLSEEEKNSKKESIVISEDEKELKIENKILTEIEVLLPSENNKLITKNFLNSLELSLYDKKINQFSFNINTYTDEKQLQKIINQKIKPGKIFVGPLASNNTKNLKQWCSMDVIFFSFASDRNLGQNCIYLINFFPEDELLTLFNHFDSKSKIALLYPENNYGYYINKIIDNIATKSEAVIISKASYKEDLTDARESIKELSKYDLRKNELERQKKLLQGKKDEISIKALKKIKKFETIGELDFTHIIIPDYNIRLLEIVPLLPFYDVDPNKIQFVGTGVWDDNAFFNEPSLQSAIFPGVEKNKRRNYIDKYISHYNEEPIRTVTIIYDLVGLLNFLIKNNNTINSAHKILNDSSVSFEGLDGKFTFEKNLIKRKLEILKISDGKAVLFE